MPEAARCGVKERIPQNGREDDARRDPLRGEGPNPSTLTRLTRQTHQCTNRCVSYCAKQTLTYSRQALLRKEVIQPHLPVRLPCYDFAPVTSLTLTSSLPKVKPPDSGTADFHGVTGGVYKTRERIHRGVLIHDY